MPALRALVFDLMGTCTDWSSSILSTLFSQPPVEAISLTSLATEWRSRFFKEIHRRFDAGEGAEDIDVTHRRILDTILQEEGAGLDVWNDEVRQKLVQGWHVQQAWPDAIDGLERLKKKFFVVVLANGTTRLQLDIIQSSGLPFHTLFSSQLLGLTKPDPNIYLKALELMGLEAAECMMVAAHAYDLRAAAKVGMRTAYIHRTTEDLNEDMSQVKQEVDTFLDGTTGKQGGGLCALADLLGA